MAKDLLNVEPVVFRSVPYEQRLQRLGSKVLAVEGELARRVQSARRINNVASHKNRFEQFENQPGLLARLSRRKKRSR